MPRVLSAKKNKAGKEIKCGRCGVKIEPGTEYLYFKKRYGSKQIRCMAHRPRQSELTSSKMSAVYAARESAENTIPTAESSEDIAQAVRDCAESADEVRQEYQDGLDAMPEQLQSGPTGEEIQEKINGLEEYQQELESAADDIENEEIEEEEDCETCDGEGKVCSKCAVGTSSCDLAGTAAGEKADPPHLEVECADCAGKGKIKTEGSGEKLQELKDKALEAVGALSL